MKALMLAIALVLVAGVAHADTEMMHACARKTGGDLRLADRCWRTEIAVEWNAQGPQGQPGKDAVLPPGTLTGVHRVDGFVADPESGTHVARCPQGESVVAGSALYSPGIDLPIIALGTEMDPTVEPGDLGNFMFILFGGFERREGTVFIEWTLVCGVVLGG